MAIFHVIDEYNVKNYRPGIKILFAFTLLYTYIAIMAYPLFLVEQGVGNIKTYEDSFYLLQMAISTIGFGDFYPSSTAGRWIIALSFYIGVGIAGFIGASIAGIFTNFTDTSVQNRELRKQNEEIIKLLKK